MTARDAGGIACRTFAAYLALLGFRSFVIILANVQLERLSVDPARFGGVPVVPLILQAGLYLLAAAILWAKSSAFWPSDQVVSPDPSMDANAWRRLAMLILGTYFFLTSFSTVLLIVLKAALQTTITWPQIGPTRTYEDCVQCLFAVCLIIYGSIGWKSTDTAATQAQ